MQTPPLLQGGSGKDRTQSVETLFPCRNARQETAYGHDRVPHLRTEGVPFPVLDLYNREILGYAISRQPNMEIVRRMMRQVFPRLPKQGEILLHSDQGCLYQSKAYRSLLQQRGITQSMSRKGNCLDNAVIENFFGILKSELIYLQKFQSLKLFIEELNKYIKYYNNKRIKSKLKGMSTVKYRINYRNK